MELEAGVSAFTSFISLALGDGRERKEKKTRTLFGHGSKVGPRDGVDGCTEK